VKRVGIAAGILAVLVAVSLAALPWFFNTPAFQTWVSQNAARALGRPVTFVSLSISIFPLPTVKLRGFQVAEDPAFGPGPFLRVGEGTMKIRLRPLLSGRVELADLTLHEPLIDLVEDGRGHFNWASLGARAPNAGSVPRGGGRGGTGGASAVLLSRVSIVNGTLRYRKAGLQSSDIRLAKVNVTVSQTAPGGALRLSGDAVAQPGNVEIKISDAVLTPAAGAPRSFGEMALKATVDVEVRDVAPLASAAVASPALAGAMTGRLLITGSPARVVATGAMRLDRLTLSEDRPSCAPRKRQLLLGDLRIPVAYTGTELDSVPFEAKVASGSISLRVSVALGSAPTAALTEIKVNRVELGSILVDFFCQPYAVSGPMDLTGEASLRVADPWRTASGSGRLRIGPGKVLGREVVTLVNDVLALAGVASSVLDLGRRLKPGSPLDFHAITATYTITNGVLKTEDLLYEAADMSIAASGTIALSDGRVRMDLTLSQGRNQVKGVVSGTTGALKVIPTAIRIEDTRGIKKFLDRLFR